MEFNYKDFKAMSFKASQHFNFKYSKAMNFIAQQADFKNLNDLYVVMNKEPNAPRLVHAQKLTKALAAAIYLEHEIPEKIRKGSKNGLIKWINDEWVQNNNTRENNQ